MTTAKGYNNTMEQLRDLMKKKLPRMPIHIFYEVYEMASFLEKVKESPFLDKPRMLRKATDCIESRGYVFFFLY